MIGGKRVRDVGCYHLFSYSALAWLRSTFDPVFCDAAVPCFYPCQRRTTNKHLRALLPKNVFCLLLLGKHLSPVVTVVLSPRCALNQPCMQYAFDLHQRYGGVLSAPGKPKTLPPERNS